MRDVLPSRAVLARDNELHRDRGTEREARSAGLMMVCEGGGAIGEGKGFYIYIPRAWVELFRKSWRQVMAGIKELRSDILSVKNYLGIHIFYLGIPNMHVLDAEVEKIHLLERTHTTAERRDLSPLTADGQGVCSSRPGLAGNVLARSGTGWD